MNHLTSIQLCAFLDDALVGAPDDQSARHLATCAACRVRYEAWCHVDDSLRELLGQVPDEHALEQRTSWVEIAVTAERKGLPAPEFAELRIPRTHGAASQHSRSHFFPAPAAPAPFAQAPPPAVAQPSPSRALLRPPVLPAPSTTPAPAPGRTYAAPQPATREQAAARHPQLAAVPPPGTSASGQAGPPAPGYARLPRAPRKGFAALLSPRMAWLAILLVAAVAVGLRFGVQKFGIPELKIHFRTPGKQGTESQKAVADAATEPEPAAKPARPRGGASHASATPEDPDASILFDLPALEPEDEEPARSASEPAKKHTAPAAARDPGIPQRSDTPTICGEVRTAQGVPIEGARVYLSSPARMVHTDRKGRFCITCPPGQRTVRIESAGRAPVTRVLQLGRERLETRFTLDAAN